MPSDVKPNPPPTFAIPYPVTNALIIVTALSSFLGWRFPRDFAPFGAGSGMDTLGGDWWRLLTSNFVHQSFLHLLGNLFFLWFFGKRVERILGKWTFLVFYLGCGLASRIVSIAAQPEAAGCGASGAIFGLAGGLASAYALRVVTPSRRELWKLALASLWSVWVIYTGFSSHEIDGVGHLGGLLAGIALGAALLSNWARTGQRRPAVFAGMAALLVLGAISVRAYSPYILHLNVAAHAIDEGRMGDALRELRIALRMKPTSELGHHLVRQMKYRTSPRDSCSSLVPQNSSSRATPCDGKECDGHVHTAEEPDGTKISYLGDIKISAPSAANGSWQTTTTMTVTTQMLDEFGEIDCTVTWSNVSRQRLDAKGVAGGKRIPVSDSYSDVLESDPKALEMKKQALAASP